MHFVKDGCYNECHCVYISWTVTSVQVPGTRDKKIGTVSGSGTGPLDYVATGPVPDP